MHLSCFFLFLPLCLTHAFLKVCVRCDMDLLEDSNYYWPDLAFSTNSSNEELRRTDFYTFLS